LRQAQAHLAHVTRVTTLGEVTASLAHEVNQPLAAIVNNANACLGLLPDGRGQDEVREALADIVSDGNRASAIIERVRGLARRSPPLKVPLHLADVVADVVALAAAESATRGIAIRTEVAPDLPVVLGDRVQLQQVLLNLLVNGMDAMSAVAEGERRLEIGARRESEDGSPAALLSVRDRGIGLPAGPRGPVVGGAQPGAGRDLLAPPPRRARRIVTEAPPTVFVVDDDASVRRSTERLVRSLGFGFRTFASAREFLDAARGEGPACLVLDVHLPGLGGLDLQRELARSGVRIPIIFITGRGSIPMTVQAMKEGAVEFLTKPVRPRDLLAAIRAAIESDRASQRARLAAEALRERYERLTPREREVMALVAAGQLNKQIAGELATSERTIKFHRAHVMEKMAAGSLAELVRMAGRLGVAPGGGAGSLPEGSPRPVPRDS